MSPIAASDTTAEFTSPSGRTFTVRGSADDRSVIKTVAENGAFEPEVMAVLEELLTPSSVALDVGANIGVLTLVMANACSAGAVFAFEPGDEAVQYLRANLHDNGVGNVTVEQTAVVDRSGTVSLEVPREGSAWSFVSEGSLGPTQDVAAVTLDDWCRLRSPERVDLIKMDIESCEVRALNGAAETLKRFHPVVIAEYNPLVFQQLQGEPPSTLAKTLRSYSRFVYALLPDTTVRVLTQRHLDLIVSQHGYLNLLASPRALPAREGQHREFLHSVRHFVSSLRQHNRRVPPRLAWFASSDVRVSAPASLDAHAGEMLVVDVEVSNNSPFWLSSNYPAIPIFCGHRWFDATGLHVDGPSHPHSLPTEVTHHLGQIAPGGRARVRCEVPAPTSPGTYELRFGIVQTQYLWIDDVDPASGSRSCVVVTADPTT